MRFLSATLVVLCITIGGSGEALCQEKPTYTDRFNGNEEVDYVLENITRKGREVTMTLSATFTKGARNRDLLYIGVNLVDVDGNEHKARVNGGANRPKAETVTLRPGVKSKLNIRFPLDPKVTKLQTLEVTSSFVERVAIRFFDLEIPNR